MQKITQLFFVDFNHLHSDLIFNLKILRLYVLEYLPCSSWYYTHQSLIKYILAIHSICLATSCLAIGKYSPIITFHYILYSFFANNLKHFLLACWWIKTVVECKTHVTMRTVIIINLHSLLVFCKHNSFTFILARISIFHLCFKFVERSKSWNNFYLLFLISHII